MKKKIVLIIVVVILATLIGGIWRIASLGNSGKGPLAFLVYLQGPVQLTEKTYDIRETEFTCINENETIRGTLFLPEDNRKSREILIFSHGFNCQCDLLKNKAKSLAAAGVPTLVYDFRGGSVRGQSDGKTQNMTVNTEVSDLSKVLETVKSYNWVDKNRIFLMGESFGGLVSALTASGRDDIAGLILCFPALSSADSSRKAYKSISEIPDTVDVNGMVTGKDFWETLWNLDVYKEIAKYKGNVIIMHGTEDQMVNIAYSVKANRTYQHSQLFEIEGSGHGFGGDDAKSSLKTAYQFITKSKQ